MRYMETMPTQRKILKAGIFVEIPLSCTLVLLIFLLIEREKQQSAACNAPLLSLSMTALVPRTPRSRGKEQRVDILFCRISAKMKVSHPIDRQ
jgi:hypothetical protein